MFSKVSFKDLAKSKNKDYGYATKLPFFKENSEVEFKPGLNIIFAPNGTGKSTILSMMATATASKQGGYSVVTRDWNGRFDTECMDGINVSHDGQAVMYCNPRQAVGLIGGQAAFDDEFFSEGLYDLKLNESTGKTTIARLGKVLGIIGGKDPFESKIEYRVPEDQIKEERRKLLEPQIEKGQQSILLDEPESGLAIHVQNNIFTMLDKAAKEKNLQIIVATHSLFALSCVDANFIELQPGYIKIARDQLDLLFMKVNDF